MWIKTTVGNHYGVFEVMGIEMYKEEEDSYILYGYLTKPIPHVPVGIDRDLKDGMTHIDFVKLHEFKSEEAAMQELNSIQSFLEEGGTGVYVVEEGRSEPRFGTFG